ncbi:MAG: cytochrome c3 family protein [Raoultibacter sp.]
MKNKKKFNVMFLLIALCGVCIFGIFGCAPQSNSSGNKTDSNEVNNATQIEWSSESDCRGCHSMEDKSLSDSQCLGSTHEKQGLTCNACHNDESGLKAAHKKMSTAKAPTELKKTQVANAVCLGCHDAATLKTATAATTVCTDSKGKVVNPHDLPINKDHEGITCSNCHAMHSDKKASTLAPEECLSCHHQNVYECNTCHS